MDNHFKVHEIKTSNSHLDCSVDDAQLMSDPSLIRVVTEQCEFSLQKKLQLVDGKQRIGPLKMATNSINYDDLKHWHERMLLLMSNHATAATNIDMRESQLFFTKPEEFALSGFDQLRLFRMAPMIFRELPSGVLRMEYSRYSERIDHRGVQMKIDEKQCYVDFDPRNNYRVISSESIVHIQKSPANKPVHSTWGRLSSIYEYDDTFGRGVVPKRVFRKSWTNLPNRDDIEKDSDDKRVTEEFLIDKVEFGTVTPADFRGEPYGVPASLIEQYHLPPPAAWWWPWLCGLLGVNALLGLVWWFKRQRESMA